MGADQPTKQRGRTRLEPRWIEEDRGFVTPCRIWQLAKDDDGYGKVTSQGRRTLAHRVAYEHGRGPIPEGLQIDHLCRQPSCVNPDHLEAVTSAENVRRGLRTKLTREVVEAIRAATGSQVEIGLRYGITQGHVSRIRGRRSWRD